MSSFLRKLTVRPLQIFVALLTTLLQFFAFALTGRRKKFKVSNTALHRQLMAGRGTRDAEAEEQPRPIDVYSDYAIVAERRFSLNVPVQGNGSTYYSSSGQQSVYTRDWIEGTKWEFSATKGSNSHCTLKVTLLETDLNANGALAEVLFWQWHRGKQIYILQKCVKVFPQVGAQLALQCSVANNYLPSDGFFNVLVRLMAKKAAPSKNICAPCPDDDSDALSLRVGPEHFVVSKHYLMAVSPVFQKMLCADMLEKANGEVSLEETSPEEFAAFLEAISPKRTQPNPLNVIGLLKLADQFQVDSLRDSCETHLANCVEIPLIERLLCAEVFRLDRLKNHILKSLSGPGLREFYEENQAELNRLSKEFLIHLTVRICSRSQSAN